MRRTRVMVGAALLLPLLIGGALLLLAANVDNYRGRVHAVLAERLGRSVSLGPMHLSVWPLGLRVERAAIGDDPAFQSGRPFAQVEALYVRPRFLPLLRGRFELYSLELRRPLIELVRSATGVWNVTTLGGTGTSASPSTLVLDRVVITGGEVAVTDLQRRRPTTGAGAAARAVYHNIDVQLRGVAPRQPFDIELAATLPGAGAQRFGVRGTAGPLDQADVARTPFDGTLQFEEASVAGLLQFFDLEALDGTDAVLSGNADLRNSGGQVSSTGSLKLTDARARGLDLGYPITTSFDITHDTGTALLTIRPSTIRLDATPLLLEGTVNLQPDTPVVDVHVTASNASLSEAARLASAFGVAFGAGMHVRGSLTADVRARGPAGRLALSGQVRLRDVSVSGTDVPSPVQAQAVDLALTPAEVRSNDFTVTTNGTSLGARVVLGRYATATPTVDASLRAMDADVGDVLNIARAWGVEAVDGVSGTGRLTLDVRASGPVSGLVYSGSGRLEDATLKTPSIAQPVRVTRARLTFGADAVSLGDLVFSLGGTTATGSLAVRELAAPRVQFELSADRIDVAEMQALLAPAGSAAPAPQGQPRTAPPHAGASTLMLTSGSGRVRVGSIVNGPLVIEDVQATATIDRGLLRLDPLTAAVYGGSHRGSITVDARRTPASFTYASTLERVDANKLAVATTNLREVIFGALTSTVRVSASADGAQAFARSMNGTLSLDVADGRIANMDLVQEVANVGRFVTGKDAQRSTSVAALTGTFRVTDGLAQTDDLTATLDAGTLGASGSINLVDESVNLRLTAVLSKAFSQRVGGTRIGGFMTTALANEQGELVVPLLMTGTMSQPRFAPDAKRIAEMKLRNLVPNLRNPQALTTGILGAIAGQQDDGRTPRQTLGDVVGAITGRGQPPPADAGTPQSAPADTPPAAAEGPATATSGGEAATPARKDPVQDLQNRLRGLLRGAKKEEPKAAPPGEAETPPAK